MAPRPRVVPISSALYPLTSIEKARDAFRHLCSIQLERAGEDASLTILPVEDSPPETADEFLNYALCAALETHLIGKT